MEMPFSCIDSFLDELAIEELSRLYTEEEVLAALHHMHPFKAPGPDGMLALFYSKFWHIVGSDVPNMTL